MIVWRVTRRRYQSEVWSGRGGLHAAGRWHPKGRPVVYAAEHPAVCALEVLVHLDRSLVPADLVLCSAALPDEGVETLPQESLPDGWDSWPPPHATRTIGAAWLQGCRSLALRVPSAAAPQSFNILLNPQHPLMRALVPGSCEPWTPDDRFFEVSRDEP